MDTRTDELKDTITSITHIPKREKPPIDYGKSVDQTAECDASNPLNYTIHFWYSIQNQSGGWEKHQLGEKKCSDFPDEKTRASESCFKERWECEVKSCDMTKDESSMALLVRFTNIRTDSEPCESHARTKWKETEKITDYYEIVVLRLNTKTPPLRLSLDQPFQEIRYFYNDPRCFYVFNQSPTYEARVVHMTPKGQLSFLYQNIVLISAASARRAHISFCRRYIACEIDGDLYLYKLNKYDIVEFDSLLAKSTGTFVPGGLVVVEAGKTMPKITHINLETPTPVKSAALLAWIGNPLFWVEHCTSDYEGNVYLEYKKGDCTRATLASIEENMAERTFHILKDIVADALFMMSLDLVKMVLRFVGIHPDISHQLFSPTGFTLFSSFNALPPAKQKEYEDAFGRDPAKRVGFLQSFEKGIVPALDPTSGLAEESGPAPSP